MGRRLSSGGGQGSLSYLFGSKDLNPSNVNTETTVAVRLGAEVGAVQFWTASVKHDVQSQKITPSLFRVLVAYPGKIVFMTSANLLAHAPHLFCCGIARSRAYNRTFTPFWRVS
nr:hypothetical protein [Tanacetum cinerariifolium]